MLIDPAIVQQLQMLLKVALAMLLGGVIGLEREARDRPAGLRTNMLMAGAAALIISLGVPLVENLVQHFGNSIRIDPGNLVQAIVIGVSFFGQRHYYSPEGSGPR